MAAQVAIIQDLQSGTVMGTPIPWVAGKTIATIRANMSDEAARNPANNLRMFLMASFDGGQSYSEGANATWTGDPADDGHNPGHPSFPGVSSTFSVSQPTHVTVKLEIGIDLTLSVGATVDLS